MGLYVFGILQFIFLNAAFAAELSCASLFEDKLNIETRTYNHILKVEHAINGIAHETPFMLINSHQQFRYFDNNERHEIKMIGKFEIGEVDKEELKYLQKFFPARLLEVQALENNKYLVHRWAVTQDVPTDFNTGLINANDTGVRAALAQVIQSISLENNPHKKAVLFLDIDNLGIVNYFPGGHVTGDAYIKTVIDVVTENLRQDDNVRYTDKDAGFKNYNGDEFFYLLEGITEDEIPTISKRLETALKTDPRIALIKFRALSRYDSFKKIIKSLRNYSEIERLGLLPYIQSTRTWNRLSENEINGIKSSSTAFKKFISLLLHSAEVKNIGANINSLNLGGTFGIVTIKLGDTLDSVLNRSSQAMGDAKMQKKSSQIKKLIKEDIYFPEL